MKALVLALMLSGPSLAQEAGQPLVPEFTDSSGAELRFLDKAGGCSVIILPFLSNVRKHFE